MPAISVQALVCGALIASAALVLLVDGECREYLTCETCVSHNLCGWCSENVVYPNNSQGARCAGFNPNGSTPFTCHGIYSTEQCIAGWSCSQENFTCYQAQPGHGTRKEDCEANCTNNGEVFLCNKTSKQCYEVPAGTPGATSYAVCEAQCSHPSAAPSSPSPANVTPAQTYVCNYTAGQCEEAEPGHGSSKEVCEQTCSKSNESYYCDKFSHTCKKLPPGSGGATLKECEDKCNPQPQPGPPPEFLGIWRGIAIQNNYHVGEWDMEFTQTAATMIDIRNAVTTKGIPYHVIDGDSIDLWINVTSGPGVGETIKAIGKSADRGPETKFLTAAFSEPGGKTPVSIDAAMKDGTSMVFFLSECAGTPECIFTMPQGYFRAPLGRNQQALPNKRRLQRGFLEELPELLRQANGRVVEPLVESTVDDPCMAYGANCTYCISHEYCGWCSQDVTYKGGQKGTQCAGFSSDPSKSNPFVCKGQYSTTQCDQGYDCDKKNLTCVPNPVPGNGHSLKVCEFECKLTPAPTILEEYLCNITAKTCHKCNETFCPGAMPETQCAAACVKPHHGPSKIVAGIWRGIQINENYELAEYELVFNASEVAAYKDDTLLWTGTIDSYGGDVMIFNLPGGMVPAIYTVADQSGLYGAMTLAFGLPNGQTPQSFAPPMQTSGMYEYVLAKCQTSPCDFRLP